MTNRKHNVSVVVQGKQIGRWEEYEFGASYIEPAGSFRLERAWSPEAWALLRRDARIRIVIDSTKVFDGHIADRGKRSKTHGLVIEGHDRAARLVQESAPAINYNDLDMVEALRRLADPWIKKITLSDARNRNLRVGKGFKVSANDGAPIPIHKMVRRGRVHPGQSRWSVMAEIASNAELMIWMSADGEELFVGRPNRVEMPALFELILAKPGSPSRTTVLEMDYDESNGDRFSLIAVVGTGGGTETDFGYNVSSRRAYVTDVDDPTSLDGTGRDFIEPKRMLMPESHFDSNGDASAIAGREQLRRDFRRTTVKATLANHGQWLDLGTPTIFAPGTIAHVRDEEMDPMLDDDFFIFSVRYRAKREVGETTELELVPQGTQMVL